MHDALLVHVFQGACYLVYVLDYSLLWEVDLVFHCLLDDELEVSLLSPFNSNEKFVELAVDEPAEVPYDVLLI